MESPTGLLLCRQVPDEAGFCTAAWRLQMCVSVAGVSGSHRGYLGGRRAVVGPLLENDR